MHPKGTPAPLAVLSQPVTTSLSLPLFYKAVLPYKTRPEPLPPPAFLFFLLATPSPPPCFLTGIRRDRFTPPKS
jgi:hypothetical protein